MKNISNKVLVCLLIVGLAFSISLYADDEFIPDQPEEKDFSISNVDIKIRKDKTVSVVLNEISDDTKSLELFAIPEECAIYKGDLKKVILQKNRCDDVINITLSQKGSYDFSVIKNSLIVIASCEREDGDCINNEDDLKFGFISKKLFKRNSEATKIEAEDINRLVEVQDVKSTVTDSETPNEN
jgi:hypothetical protein